ncbi:unnamed protein product [Cylindrotheca closterium]|uniref:Protein kinase domain-containing protein n=1 Tax=Cylindrotheca closterium TaxID=2856 RepID=A0AAD2FQL0_9STRA|nr:unnamed protein product [Cylindrotheca closterium]
MKSDDTTCSSSSSSSPSVNSLYGSYSDHFPIHFDSIVLNDEVTAKVLRNAQKRMNKSSILPYYDSLLATSEDIGEIAHHEVVLDRMLGHGSFSSVFAIKKIRGRKAHKYDAESLVVKVLRPKLSLKPSLMAACAADIVMEGMLLSTLSHKNIISIKATSPMGICSFANGRHDAYFLVMEKLEETLEDRIQRWQSQKHKTLFHHKLKDHLMLQEQIQVLTQLGDAIQHLHSQRILYRDAKPANIGFDKDGVLKIFDFDVAKILPDSTDPNEMFQLTKRTGSPRYMAPEIAKGEPYNLKADVYSYSLICHEVMTLKKPFGTIASAKHDQAVFYDGVRPEVLKSWPRGFVNLLKRSWSTDVVGRPTMEEAIKILQTEFTIMLTIKTPSRKVFNIRRPKTAPIFVA